jgi:hypothetical protein
MPVKSAMAVWVGTMNQHFAASREKRCELFREPALHGAGGRIINVIG